MSAQLRPRDLRLTIVAGAAWSVALVCVFLESISWAVAGCLWFACLVAVGTLWSRRSRLPTPLGLIAVVLAISAGVASAVGFVTPERLAVRAHDGFSVEIVADISSALTPGRDGRLWFDAQTLSVAPPGETAPVRAPVRIGVAVPADGPPNEWEMGARIRVTGQARGTDSGERAALVVFSDGAVTIVHPAPPLFHIAGDVRQRFVERAVRLPEPGAGLLPGLAVGDTRAVSDTLHQAMLTSGLSHLTAVSGANCALVVGAMYGLVALVHGGRMLRIIAAAVALAAFVILVTPEPSVVRAATMAAIGMLTLLLGRPGAGVGVLSSAVGIILIFDPWLAAAPGFALSAAATAALIVLARPVARGLDRWMPTPLAVGVAVPLAAQLACGPILALFAEQQSLIGVLANMLAAPAAPIATVIGLLACLALPIPPLADLFAASAWLPAAWIAQTAFASAAVPGGFVLIQPGIGAALLVTILTVAATTLLVRGRHGRLPPRRLRAVSAAVLSVALGIGGGVLMLRGPLTTMTTPEAWSVAVCDVGQGDALLVRSGDRVALLDTGPAPDALRHCLQSLGIDHIDLLVLTHFDLDHVGGADAVLGRVGLVLHGPAADRGDQRLLTEFERAGAEVVEGFAGQRGSLGDANWHVLWPVHGSRTFPPGNDTSLVLEVEGPAVPRSLFLGDLGASAQRHLLRTGGVRGPFVVVKVAHHGSRDQEPALYAAAEASIALFPVGENTYGHPHPDTLRLVSPGHVLRTDQRGRILLGIESGAIKIWSEWAGVAEGNHAAAVRWRHGCPAFFRPLRRQDREDPAAVVARTATGADRAGVRTRGSLRRACDRRRA